MSTWPQSLLLIATLACSVQAAVINPVAENIAKDGLLSIPFVGVDRKAAYLPKWGFQKVDGESSSVKVPLKNIDLAYLMNVSVGTPPQKFTLLLDTGSSTTWVPVENCGIFCGSPPHSLAMKNSSTFQLMDMPFSIRYGEGFSRGYYAKDTFTFDGGVAVPNTAFAVSTFNDGELSGNGADGIIGIGPDALSKYNNPGGVIVPTIVSSMQQAGVIHENMFSIYFKALDDTERDNGRVNGNIIFGGIDLTKVEGGNITYIPITSNTAFEDYWAIDINAITVDGQKTTYKNPLAGLVDTGSTLVFLPRDIIVSILGNVSGLSIDRGGQYLVPCDTPDIKPITFSMGDHEFTLNPQEYIVPFSVGGAVYQSQNYCYTYLHESPNFVDVILGYGFLQRFVSVYDDGNKRIGLGRSLDVV